MIKHRKKINDIGKVPCFLGSKSSKGGDYVSNSVMRQTENVDARGSWELPVSTAKCVE